MIRIAGRGCVVCGTIPTKIVKYKFEDITRVERYCDKHIVCLTATNGDESVGIREKNSQDRA